MHNPLSPEKRDDYAATVLPDETFDQFIEACETSSEPNQALRDAVSDAREQGFLDTPEEGAPKS